MKETVRERKLSMARLVHMSVVKPRLTRSSLTAASMAQISFFRSSAFLPAILDSVVGCLTFTLLLRTLTTFWKDSPHTGKKKCMCQQCG